MSANQSHSTGMQRRRARLYSGEMKTMWLAVVRQQPRRGRPERVWRKSCSGRGTSAEEVRLCDAAADDQSHSRSWCPHAGWYELWNKWICGCGALRRLNRSCERWRCFSADILVISQRSFDKSTVHSILLLYIRLSLLWQNSITWRDRVFLWILCSWILFEDRIILVKQECSFLKLNR